MRLGINITEMKYAIEAITNTSGDAMYSVKMADVKKAGEAFIKRTPNAKAVYSVNHYDKATKSYSCSDCNDMNKEVFIKSSKTVFVGFTY